MHLEYIALWAERVLKVAGIFQFWIQSSVRNKCWIESKYNKLGIAFNLTGRISNSLDPGFVLQNRTLNPCFQTPLKSLNFESDQPEMGQRPSKNLELQTHKLGSDFNLCQKNRSLKPATFGTNFAYCDLVNLFKNRTLKLSCKALNMKSSLFDISILTIASSQYILCISTGQKSYSNIFF